MRIALLGDMAFFGAYSVKTNDHLRENLSEISDYLGQFDLVVGNLETPFSQRKKPYGAKSAYICSDPENIELLHLLHVGAVTLANNHMFDYGNEGYELTKKLLKDANIEWFGSEGKELQIEKAGSKLALSGFCCYSTNPLKCVKFGEYGVNAYNLIDAKSFIQRSISNGYLPLLAVHAGLEHVNYPSLEHVRAARLLSETGNYIYYGHHPHVIQGVEDYNGSLIAHSLGNFCFDDVYTIASKTEPLIKLTDNNRKGMILELSLAKNMVISRKEQLIYIKDNGFINICDSTDYAVGYNDALKACEVNMAQYEANRNIQLINRTKERKLKRTASWYLKRMRPRYLKLFIDMKRNQIRYKDNVKRYI